MKPRDPVWLFDLDNTLHDAGAWVFGQISAAMTEFLRRELGLSREEADELRRHYWRRYGATLLGVVKHHDIRAAHFLHDTHRLPELEQRVGGHRHDAIALARLRGRKFVLTNAPQRYAERVLAALGIARHFEAVIAIERMKVFGELRPKPDARMLRVVAARLKVPPSRCVLVEDTLEHQRAAKRIGMQTVWMQRYMRPAPAGGVPPAPARPIVPAYVDRIVHGLRELC